jgi:hypothetical protein
MQAVFYIYIYYYSFVDLDDAWLMVRGAVGCLPASACRRRRKNKKKRQQSKCLVTTVPDFDGYQWRKYGQKQIEGAMYPRYISISCFFLHTVRSE